MDKYLQLTLELHSNLSAPDGTMEALLHNCEKQNLFSAFHKIIDPYLLQVAFIIILFIFAFVVFCIPPQRHKDI